MPLSTWLHTLHTCYDMVDVERSYSQYHVCDLLPLTEAVIKCCLQNTFVVDLILLSILCHAQLTLKVFEKLLGCVECRKVTVMDRVCHRSDVKAKMNFIYAVLRTDTSNQVAAVFCSEFFTFTGLPSVSTIISHHRNAVVSHTARLHEDTPVHAVFVLSCD